MNISDAIQDAVDQGLSTDIASKVINKLWGYNVRELFIWQVSSDGSGVAYTELKNGKSFDTYFNKTGGIVRRKMISNEKIS